jgi:phenylpyruvate tautomerase PptA (4-oxalocrotonate tautomerase family)
MPIIDVHAAADLFPVGTDRVLAEELTGALLRAEGVTTPSPLHLDNTAAYVHRLPTTGVHTARTASARTVPVQVLTPPGVLNGTAQKRLVGEVTDIIARISGDPSQAARTWVLLTEAAEGGWGIAGTAYGHDELAGLARAVK